MPADSMSLDDLQSFYTVIGCWPESHERYAEHISAVSPRQAEDLAQLGAREKGGVLWVCGVFEGKINAVDTYAQFIDPEMTTEAEW